MLTWLTACTGANFEKPTIIQMLKKCPAAFYEARFQYCVHKSQPLYRILSHMTRMLSYILFI
jgi:hypothetical protein